jgi:hypothetical protein
MFMRTLVLFFVIQNFAFGQIHNRVMKFNMGVTYDQFTHKNLFDAINDTSSHELELVTAMPVMAYSHEFVANNIISFSGRVGFQYLNEFYDYQHFGSSMLFLSLNPQVSIFYRRGFEYYIKLQVGGVYRFQKTDLLDDQMRRLFSDNLSVFTGVTIGGFNYFISDHLGLNLEINLWSPELATFGISYRYFKGELPEIETTKEL